MATVRTWRGKLVLDYYDEDKKRHILQMSSPEEAYRRLEEIKDGGNKAPMKKTFKEYGEWWLENCARVAIKESTYLEYERTLRIHLYPCFGSKQFTKITRKMVRELVAAKQKDGLSQSSIKNILAPIRGIYNQAIEDEEVHRNPAERMGKFNKRLKPQPKINPLAREEVQIVLDKAEKELPHFYPVFLCAQRTGIRQGELIALKGIDVDFNARFIDVQRNLSRGKITTPKNGKTRRVDMSKQLAGVLEDLLAKRKAAALRKEMEKPAGERRDGAAVINEVMEGWLFPNPQGTQLDPSNLRKLFYKLLTAAKLRRVRFHDLRHTFASLLIEQGESLAYIRDQMGHSSIKITVDTYGHLVPGGNRQAVDKLDQRVPVSEAKAATAA